MMSNDPIEMLNQAEAEVKYHSLILEDEHRYFETGPKAIIDSTNAPAPSLELQYNVHHPCSTRYANARPHLNNTGSLQSILV